MAGRPDKWSAANIWSALATALGGVEGELAAEPKREAVREAQASAGAAQHLEAARSAKTKRLPARPRPAACITVTAPVARSRNATMPMGEPKTRLN